MKLSLDLSSVSATKQEFILSKDMVNAPSNLAITEIKPAKTYIYASRLITGSFPVQITTQNSLPKNLMLQKMTISPYKIKALYDSRLNADNIRLQTEPIDLQKISTTSTLDVKAILPAGVYFPEDKPPALRVIIRVKNK